MKTWIKNHKIELSLSGVIIGLAIILLSLVSSIRTLKDNIGVYEHNNTTLKSDIKELELKNGELMTINSSLILDKNELVEELGLTKREIKDIEKKLNSSLAYISKLEGQIQIDTLYLNDSTLFIGDSTFVYFAYNDEWFGVDGETLLVGCDSYTKLNHIKMDAPLKVGLTDDYQIFVNTLNPYITFSSIEGAVVNESNIRPKETRWGLSVFIGPTGYIGYGLGTSGPGIQVGVGIGVGLGVTYKIL